MRQRSWSRLAVARLLLAFPGTAGALEGAGRIEGDRPQLMVRTLLGLLALLVFAWIAGHPRVQEWERRARISQVVTAGFPFVLLGIVARHPAVGIVTDPALARMDALLAIALGSIGLAAGFRFDAKLLSALPEGAGRVVALATSIPFAAVLAFTGLALLSLSPGRPAQLLCDPAFVRDATILATAGTMTARTSTRLLTTAESANTLSNVIRIEEIAGVAGLALIGAYLRPPSLAGWQLPGTAWLLLTIGLGAVLGAVMYAMLEWTPARRPEFVVLTLGSVSFAAGVAASLNLSPVVTTFIAGVLLANFPGTYKARLGSALRRLERPVYLLFLFAIGALWEGSDWRGWILMPVFMATRLIGKRVAANVAAARAGPAFGAAQREALAVSPTGPLAIAIVVNAQLLYRGGSVSLIASTVIGGALLTEVAVQLVASGKISTLERRRFPRDASSARSSGESSACAASEKVG